MRDILRLIQPNFSELARAYYRPYERESALCTETFNRRRADTINALKRVIIIPSFFATSFFVLYLRIRAPTRFYVTRVLAIIYCYLNILEYYRNLNCMTILGFTNCTNGIERRRKHFFVRHVFLSWGGPFGRGIDCRRATVEGIP